MSCIYRCSSVNNDETSFIIKFVTLLLRRFFIDLIIELNIPRAQRSKGFHTPTNISDSYPTLSINFASVYILSTCVLFILHYRLTEEIFQ